MTITAVFGVDDFTISSLDLQEGADGVAITAGLVSVDMSISESADFGTIYGQNIITNVVTVAAVESSDGCAITGIVANVVPVAVDLNRYFVEVMGTDYTIEVKAPPILVGEAP